jgi:PAS domain S-box-containing protein
MSTGPLHADQDAVQETLLGEALEHGPVAALVFDETGTFLAANRMACELTGYERPELLKKRSPDLAADPTVVPTRLREIASGRLGHGVGKLRRKDGEVVEVQYRVGATRSGGLPYFVFVFWEYDDKSTER